ncbi:bifunctional alpha/beta hydrolase/OsmC family protein [Thalassospira aquimaris]|uniref:Bifunctional alpha/beta hydrolase/OsmC family protein n=1 Tax=Thalassospira aquimaris TaxID=3037796 RepID=A0ABT6GBV9_9PROT|nr:bifunctional alpha/beta hydrolase/OsmC family protein [Thalassospira sp. FZY0004]MDG4719475.1 bifunctional alpha/beta hydrolase/OsmC family protein [Thalassospira sp. FZY0004]
MPVKPIKLTFEGAHGAELAARLDLPVGPVRAYALFAHCFTCSKDLTAARKIAQSLTLQGIGVLRFDFTGLGGSGGDFSSTNFTSNLEDLRRAADFLRHEFAAPKLLIGHSLGGAAVLAVADSVPEATAIATIGAPADVEHVTHNFADYLADIDRDGQAEVSLGGRPFVIKRQFVDDLRNHSIEKSLAKLHKALLVLHAPMDQTVGIENAGRIYDAAKHPKSFVSLDDADHLLRNPDDAEYVATVIAAWATRYIPQNDESVPEPAEGVVVRETGLGKFQSMVVAGQHRMIADEPENVGGFDSGPSPYDFLSSALGACTVMTLRLYADQKQIPLDAIRVEVRHAKVHADDCAECAGKPVPKSGKIDRFERLITLHGDFTDDVRARLLEIADKCPVHRTLEASSVIVTQEQPA